MAALDEIPEALHSLALRVPADVRENLSALDLELRCAHAADLLARAEGAGERGRGMRRRAEKVLSAVSPQAYQLAHGVLDDELAQARLNGDERAAFAVMRQMHELERRNPFPPADMYLRAAEVMLTRQLKIPGPPKDHLWNRRGRKHKSRKG